MTLELYAYDVIPIPETFWTPLVHACTAYTTFTVKITTWAHIQSRAKRHISTDSKMRQIMHADNNSAVHCLVSREMTGLQQCLYYKINIKQNVLVYYDFLGYCV